jgi:hypothetical protein
MHHISHWGFKGTWSGCLCLEKRNINLKVFVYERSGTGHMLLATRPGMCVVKLGETRRVWISIMKPGRLEQEHCFLGRGHCFPGIEVLLALYNFLLCTAYKPNAKIKNLPVGHQPSSPIDLCLDCSFLS